MVGKINSSFQKTFDKGPYKKLLGKLGNHGVRGKTSHGLKPHQDIGKMEKE